MSPIELLTPAAKADVATLTWKKLATKTTGQAPPMPDGKNLWIEIDIDIGNGFALFHCRDEEHVSAQKSRFITFRADQDCLLRFTNPAVFDCEDVQLFAHTEKVLPIRDDLRKHSKTRVETAYDVYTMSMPTEPVARAFEVKAPLAVAAKRPPVIVVP